jgi:hypothetical protein
MGAIGALFRLAYEWVRPWSREPHRLLLYAIFLWMAFLFLRFGTLGFTLLYLIQFELPGVIVALLVLNTSAHRRPRSPEPS